MFADTSSLHAKYMQNRFVLSPLCCCKILPSQKENTSPHVLAGSHNSAHYHNKTQNFIITVRNQNETLLVPRLRPNYVFQTQSSHYVG